MDEPDSIESNPSVSSPSKVITAGPAPGLPSQRDPLPLPTSSQPSSWAWRRTHSEIPSKEELIRNVDGAISHADQSAESCFVSSVQRVKIDVLHR